LIETLFRDETLAYSALVPASWLLAEKMNPDVWRFPIRRFERECSLNAILVGLVHF
jgi:hypothetical protein